MTPEINPEITHDSMAPLPPKAGRVEPAAAEPKPIPFDPSNPTPEPAACVDPDCPVCRWKDIVMETEEDLDQTEVFKNLVDGGYPVGFSFALLPKRISADHSTAMLHLMEGLGRAAEGNAHAVIPETRVKDVIAAMEAHLEEEDDLLALTVINDRMIANAIKMLGVALNPYASAEKKAAALKWYRSMTGVKPNRKS